MGLAPVFYLLVEAVTIPGGGGVYVRVGEGVVICACIAEQL